MPKCGQVDGLGLTAFIGQKIQVVECPTAEGRFNAHFRARYRVLQTICGDLVGEVFEFDVYDHYGTPVFTEYETVLLYVSRYERGYVHQKYIFDPLYQTVDGGWAGCGDPHDWRVPRDAVETTFAKLVKPVSQSVAGLPEEFIARRYKREYYTRKGDEVICTSGAPVEQLFAIQRLGVLKNREESARRWQPTRTP